VKETKYTHIAKKEQIIIKKEEENKPVKQSSHRFPKKLYQATVEDADEGI